MRARVLIVDDCKVTTLTITKCLEPDGFEVRSAHSGRDGLREALEFRPDAILLDRRLPDIDGVEVCRRFRLAETTKSTPILMLTSTGDTKARVEAIELGADDYIVKPFEPSELVARINRFLATRSQYSERVVVERKAAIGQITLGLCHEINNPLTTVIGQLEMLLRRGELNAGDRERASAALEGAKRVRTLVENATAPPDSVSELGGQAYISLERARYRSSGNGG
jgi:DNA-binding response OmpR family regulator